MTQAQGTPASPQPTTAPALQVATDSSALDDQKSVEYYASTVSAWYATTLEHDKSLFALAGGGIGIMISLLTTVGFDQYWILVLFVVTIGAFMVCLVFLLKIFEGNRDYLEAIIDGNHEGKDGNLKKWDRLAKRAFFVGVGVATLVALSTATIKISTKLQEEKRQMANQNPPASGRTMAHDSVQGAAKLQPLGKSFQGAANLAPGTPAASAAAAPTASAPVGAQAVPAASSGTPASSIPVKKP
jgi:Ca2+/Na+ antiporter